MKIQKNRAADPLTVQPFCYAAFALYDFCMTVFIAHLFRSAKSLLSKSCMTFV